MSQDVALNFLHYLSWCTKCSHLICFCRGWIGLAFALLILFIAIFMLLTRCCSQGRPDNELKVIAPPPMNTVEQLSAVQNAISQVEELVQDGNIVLLKLRALLLAVFPQVMVPFVFVLLLLLFYFFFFFFFLNPYFPFLLASLLLTLVFFLYTHEWHAHILFLMVFWLWLLIYLFISYIATNTIGNIINSLFFCEKRTLVTIWMANWRLWICHVASNCIFSSMGNLVFPLWTMRAIM